ncbi:MAG: FecCD family ABC transporter permease [Lachnospirales bacterium]
MNKKLTTIAIISTLAAIIGMIVAVSFGAKIIPLNTVFDSFFNFDETSIDMQLVRNMRFPRALATFMVGGLLAICGAMMQGVTRNPIAEPTLMGISQGATFAVALSTSSLTFFGQLGLTNSISALIGAFISGSLVIAFSMKNARNMNISRLLLAGTALSTLFLSLSTITALLSGQSQQLAFWISGGFRSTTWETLKILMPIGIVCTIYTFVLAPKINIVNLGEDICIGLGEDPVKIRFKTLLLIIPICAICVSTAGNVAFVGLIVPYIVRKILGQDYRYIIPISFLVGASLLVWADVFARLINQPYETPIGLFTSIIGVPLFLYMIRKEN